MVADMLADRSSRDPELKKLMSAVSSRTATPEQLTKFGNIARELRASIARGPAATKASMSSVSAQQSRSVQPQLSVPVKAEASSQRAPLQTLPANALVKSEPQQLKRKREQPQSSTKPQVSIATRFAVSR